MKELIVITGYPGSGKTTLGQKLADHYGYLFISKDMLKECMFDALGTKDKEWSLKVSTAAHRIMDELIRAQLRVGQGVIVESNFKVAIDSDRFTHLVNDFNAACAQVLCEASGDTLFQRWTKRIDMGERHEGHVERIGLKQIKADLSQPYEPLHLPGKLIHIDTTDFSTIDTQARAKNILK